VCFGSGTCKVLSLGSAPATTTLDTIGDGTTFTTPGPVTNPGETRGIAINNTLHLLVTDAGGPNSITNTTGSNIVEYQIAGSDPLGNPVPHGVATVFDGGGGTGAAGVQAVALNKAAHMFVLNANPPTVVELNPNGSFANS